MRVKKVAACVILGSLTLVGLTYGVLFLGEMVVAIHNRAISGVIMTNIYTDLRRFRETSGRWPESLTEMVQQKESLVGPGYDLDPISRRPLLYYPDAKPGTKTIIVAQPEPLKAGLCPFITMKRWAIRADGKLVDLSGDERDVDESK